MLVERSSQADIEFLELFCKTSPNLHPLTPWSIFQKLLPIALRKLLPENVVNPLLQLSKLFSDLCSKELRDEDLERLSKTIPETLCQLEMIFPPAFFDIMMHLPIHLAEEARLGGPVLYR